MYLITKFPCVCDSLKVIIQREINKSLRAIKLMLCSTLNYEERCF